MPEITLLILAFKSCNELDLVAYTIVFTCFHKKNLMESNLANVEANVKAMGIKVILKKMKLFFYLSKNCCKFCGEELFNNYT